MPFTFAIPDIHGRIDLLDDVLRQIEAHSPDGGTVVFLGDYIDRGPSGRQVLERLIAGPPSAAWTWIPLRGNHEEIMITCWLGQASLNWWTGNGGETTLRSYGADIGKAYEDLRAVVPREHVEWAYGLPLFHDDRYRVFVHGGVEDGVPLDRQEPERLTWKLYRPGDPTGLGDRHVVHGHHAHAQNPRTWGKRTALDTGVYMTGRLVAAIFDDDVPGAPVGFLTAAGAPDFRLFDTTHSEEETADAAS